MEIKIKKEETEEKNKIIVEVVNPPNKEESSVKIKELSEFLSLTWVMSDNSE